MDKIKLEILDLSPSQLQAGSFTLILSEANGDRRLPIIIGMFEAQAIAIEMEKITPTRPLTHDLFKSFSKSFDFSVEEVHISDISEGVFYSKIICTDGIRQKNIDARPSDAIAIALRFNASIYTNENVLNEAGISSDDLGGQETKKSEPKNIKVKSSSDLMSLNADELHKMLDEAIRNEEYEKAAKIRDEIDKRN
ncbi:MAG TPA: bifunctional nuclease domain-containing protein [Leadbetterella sp.]|nr:bifunctional nuclease domain-containing protein [Leadbetterella sp.]